jgi:DNA-binding response OmpR family regulator
MNILVCDDDRAIVDAIEIYLSQEGYTVVKAYDGLDALKKLQENDRYGWNPDYHEDPGDQQCTDHLPVSQIRGCG